MPTVHTFRCVLHRQHLVAKKLSDALHKILQMCIQSIKLKLILLIPDCAKLCEENYETHPITFEH